MLLYDFARSGNCHKVRLLLSMLGIEYQKQDVDLLGAAQFAPAFESVNSLRQVPVLVDGSNVIRDSHAILVYLASKYGRQWLPSSPEDLAHVMEWLAFSSKEIFCSLQPARLYHLIGEHADIAAVTQASERVLFILELHLRSRIWLVGDQQSIADIACFPYVALAHDARISLTAYPAVRAWIERIEAIPGYLGMPGLGDGTSLVLDGSGRYPFMSSNWMAMVRNSWLEALPNHRSSSTGALQIIERLQNVPRHLPCSHGGEAGSYIVVVGWNAEVVFLGPDTRAGDIEIISDWEDAQRAAQMRPGEELEAFRNWQRSEGRLSIRGDLAASDEVMLRAIQVGVASRTQSADFPA